VTLRAFLAWAVFWAGEIAGLLSLFLLGWGLFVALPLAFGPDATQAVEAFR